MTGNSGEKAILGLVDRIKSEDLESTKTAGLFEELGMLLFPHGCILPYFKTDPEIPRGWVVCNGENGTPDLRKKILVGADALADVGASYGANVTRDLNASKMNEGDDKCLKSVGVIFIMRHHYL